MQPWGEKVPDGSKHFDSFKEAAKNVFLFASGIVWKEKKVFKANVLQQLRVYAKTKWQNEVAVFSFSALFVKQTKQFLPYNAARRSNSILSLTNVIDMWCNTVTDVYLT